MSDYCISWGYIVSRMESLYGIEPDSEEKVAYGDIERRMNYIWQEYFEMLYKEEFGAKMDEQEYNPCQDCSDYDGAGGCYANGVRLPASWAKYQVWKEPYGEGQE